jgi:hypothetical protein
MESKKRKRKKEAVNKVVNSKIETNSEAGRE